MRFGVQVRATAETGDMREIGRALEGSGFDALYLPEHTHILLLESISAAPTWERGRRPATPMSLLPTGTL